MNESNTTKQLHKLMKTAIILFITLLPYITIAQEKKQTITIQQTNISVKEAFALIEAQTNYTKLGHIMR